MRGGRFTGPGSDVIVPDLHRLLGALLCLLHGLLNLLRQTLKLDQLGVSRGPLREGMQRLTQEGLLVAIRNRGLFVIDMTAEDIRDMYIAREAIERAAARDIVVSGDFVAARDAAMPCHHLGV